MRYSIALLFACSTLTGCSSAIEMLDAPLRSFRNTYPAPTVLTPLTVPPELAADDNMPPERPQQAQDIEPAASPLL